VTAAGLSTRMGTVKALLPWRNTSLICHQVRALLKGGCGHVVIVLGHECARISDEIQKTFPEHLPITLTCNIDYETGRASTIKQGILSSPKDSSGFLLIGVDQPTEGHIVARIIKEHEASRMLISSPRYKDNGGHPVLFSNTLKGELLRINDETLGLKPVFENYRSRLNRIDFKTSQVRLDINDYESYIHSYELFGNKT